MVWIVCICGGMFLYFAQVTTLFPVLPLYVVQRWPEAPVGFVVGAMAAGLLCFRPGVGWLIDRWGRKPVLLVGLGLMVVILPLYFLAPTPGVLMGVRVLHGISQAAFATASQTMLVDCVPPAQRSPMLGYLAMANTIGFSLGPIVGSMAFRQGGFGQVLLVSAGLTLIGLLVAIALPWHTTPLKNAATAAHSTWWTVVRVFPVRDATLLFFVGSFLHGAVVTFLPLWVEQAALFYSLNAMVAVVVRFGLGRWSDQRSSRGILVASLFCSGLGLLGLAIAPQGIILWSIVYGLGFGSLFPVLSAIVSLAAPASVRGRVYSIFLAGFDSGMTLGGAGVQPLLTWMALPTVFCSLGGLGWLASAIALRQFSRAIAPIDEETSS